AGAAPGGGAAPLAPAASVAAALPRPPAASPQQGGSAGAAPAAQPTRAGAPAQIPPPPIPARPSAATPSGSPPPAPAGGAAQGTGAPRSTKVSTGKSRSVDVLSELEKLRREAMQPAPSATGTHPAGHPPSAAALLGAQTAPARAKAGASSNGRAELSRSVEMTLKRSEFVRARRILLSFQVEDDQHRVVDAVRDLQVEIKDTADLEKLLLRFNIALHAKE
ncbi:MAG TPA: hypothetical protein VMW75_12510, partial [Thermoanaerobaculia bacterium]|nr:hypothetical protein [Thermoanaerobaculia bacterium]